MEGLIETDGQFVFTAAEQRALKGVARSRADEGDGILILLESAWQRDNKIVEVLRQPLTRLGATYLLTARNSLNEPSDRVAHFHLSNGARVERLNFLVDSSQ